MLGWHAYLFRYVLPLGVANISAKSSHYTNVWASA